MPLLNAPRLAALGAWLVTLMAFVGAAGSEPLSLLSFAGTFAVEQSPAVERPRPKDSSIRLNEIEAFAMGEPSTPVPDPDWPTITTSVADREPTDLRSLIGDGERWRLVEFGAAATWRPLAAKLTAFGQVPYLPTEPADTAPAFDGAHDPAALGVTAKVGGFEAGAQYRSAGKRLERLIGAPAALKDREGHEVWVAQRLGLLRLRLSDSELTDNVDRNPALPRTTKDQSAVTVELSLPAWPVLGLTYASGDSARFRLAPQGPDEAPEQHAFESVTGSAYYYGGPGWDITASSSLSQSRHAVRLDEQMAMLSQDLSLTLRPLESVTVVPAISLGQERYAWSAVRSDTSTAALTLSYAPPANSWWASTFVSHTSTRASDGSTDGRSISLSGALTYALGTLLPGRSTLSFEAGYDRYVDAVVPASSSRAISGFVLLKIAAF